MKDSSRAPDISKYEGTSVFPLELILCLLLISADSVTRATADTVAVPVSIVRSVGVFRKTFLSSHCKYKIQCGSARGGSSRWCHCGRCRAKILRAYRETCKERRLSVIVDVIVVAAGDDVNGSGVHR
jgi:predicted PP-loop superfamily ATPase